MKNGSAGAAAREGVAWAGPPRPGLGEAARPVVDAAAWPGVGEAALPRMGEAGLVLVGAAARMGEPEVGAAGRALTVFGCSVGRAA
jgi:hypothetical protein